jgi:hypothetical protein
MNQKAQYKAALTSTDQEWNKAHSFIVDLTYFYITILDFNVRRKSTV